MSRINALILPCVVAACLATGCKPKIEPVQQVTSGYFKTRFQEESQFIAEAVISDIAEQIYYARFQKLPDKASFSVDATDIGGLSPDAPAYQAAIHFDAKHQLFANITFDDTNTIWSPASYAEVTASMARLLQLKIKPGAPDSDTTMLGKLTDGSPTTIEAENDSLSGELHSDFTNAGAHERAAALLGAFLMRDHSGHFFEIRSPLSRMTAHLAMARLFNGKNSSGINGRLAEAMLLTLVSAQSQAIKQLDSIETNDVAVAQWVRALRARNTGDYRGFGDDGLCGIEEIEKFFAYSQSVSPVAAWDRLAEAQKQTVDYIRIANQENYSVEMGHDLLQKSMPLESAEIDAVYKASHHQDLPKDAVVSVLNQMPEHCVTAGDDGTARVRVIGWGQWANFLQRHLCHAIRSNFDFMQNHWGVPDEATEFSKECDKQFSRLYLYPFALRLTCWDTDSYHQSVDDGFNVTIATPHLVPAECWNYLCYNVRFGPTYRPVSNPHINEWHNHNPPPGTVYDLHPRLNHPSLTSRGDAAERMDQLHALAPYNTELDREICNRKYNKKATQDQASALYGPVLAYNVAAIRAVSGTLYNNPDEYEKLMRRGAALDSSCYYDLADFESNRGERDKAADCLEKAVGKDPDAVRIAAHAPWRVEYYMEKGEMDRARKIADFAGEVYSYRGLLAKGNFYELTTNWDQAFEWYRRIEERYDDSMPLINFSIWLKSVKGDARFDPEVRKRMSKLFPKGIEKVTLANFSEPPTDGVLIEQQSDLLTAAGLKSGAVIVAIYGIRVHTLNQFQYLRDSTSIPGLELIVWQDNAYKEVKANPPNRRFGVSIVNYWPANSSSN